MADRVANHRRVIDAALAAGVQLVAYTSMSQADTATNILAATHRATEEYLRERGVPAVVLRNSWYLENYTGQLPMVLQNGTVIGAAAITAAAGTQVTYTDLPAHALAQVLTGAGLPADVANSVADADLGLGRGELFTDSGDLRRLIGRPTTSLAAAVADALG